MTEEEEYENADGDVVVDNPIKLKTIELTLLGLEHLILFNKVETDNGVTLTLSPEAQQHLIEIMRTTRCIPTGMPKTFPDGTPTKPRYVPLPQMPLIGEWWWSINSYGCSNTPVRVQIVEEIPFGPSTIQNFPERIDEAGGHLYVVRNLKGIEYCCSFPSLRKRCATSPPSKSFWSKLVSLYSREA